MVDYTQKATKALQQVRQELVQEMDRVDAALAALGGGTPAGTRSTRSTKPCCNKNEVIAILTGLLRDNGSLSKTELEDLAKDKVRNQLGKSLSGFAMRLNEALADPQFTEVTPGNYQLALDVAG